MPKLPEPAELARAGRLLGLDVGDRRIGLAVSIPPGELILPAGYLRRRNLRSDVAGILAESAARDAAAIIVGMPYDAQGRPGAQARKTATLVRALERAAGIPVLLVDEAFTSNTAEREAAPVRASTQPRAWRGGCRRRRRYFASLSGRLGASFKPHPQIRMANSQNCRKSVLVCD